MSRDVNCLLNGFEVRYDHLVHRIETDVFRQYSAAKTNREGYIMTLLEIPFIKKIVSWLGKKLFALFKSKFDGLIQKAAKEVAEDLAKNRLMEIDLLKIREKKFFEDSLQELRDRIAKLERENVDLKRENAELKEALHHYTNLEFKEPVYYRKGDNTPFCPICWEVDKKTVHLIIHDTNARHTWCCVHKRPFMLNRGVSFFAQDDVDPGSLR